MCPFPPASEHLLRKVAHNTNLCVLWQFKWKFPRFDAWNRFLRRESLALDRLSRRKSKYHLNSWLPEPLPVWEQVSINSRLIQDDHRYHSLNKIYIKIRPVGLNGILQELALSKSFSLEEKKSFSSLSHVASFHLMLIQFFRERGSRSKKEKKFSLKGDQRHYEKSIKRLKRRWTKFPDIGSSWRAKNKSIDQSSLANFASKKSLKKLSST